MENLLADLVLAPVLVACSTLVYRRWGAPAGGLVSAFPAVVGPVLLITAHEHGAVFTGRAADGTLLGLATLAAFSLAYSRAAARARWCVSLLIGWLCAAALAVPVGWMSRNLGFPGGLLVATISLIAAHAALPPSASKLRRLREEGVGMAGRERPDGGGAREIALRMVLTTALVVALAAAAGGLGPLVGGMLAGLPVLASVLATRTHRRDGSDAVIELLRGMLRGMSGFVGFCAVVAALIVPAGTAATFGVATLVAVLLQAGALERAALTRPVATES